MNFFNKFIFTTTICYFIFHLTVMNIVPLNYIMFDENLVGKQKVDCRYLLEIMAPNLTDLQYENILKTFDKSLPENDDKKWMVMARKCVITKHKITYLAIILLRSWDGLNEYHFAAKNVRKSSFPNNTGSHTSYVITAVFRLEQCSHLLTLQQVVANNEIT